MVGGLACPKVGPKSQNFPNFSGATVPSCFELGLPIWFPFEPPGICSQFWRLYLGPLSRKKVRKFCTFWTSYWVTGKIFFIKNSSAWGPVPLWPCQVASPSVEQWPVSGQKTRNSHRPQQITVENKVGDSCSPSYIGYRALTWDTVRDWFPRAFSHQGWGTGHPPNLNPVSTSVNTRERSSMALG